MKKIVNYTLGLAVLVVLGYHSVYFEKLDERQAASATEFDAEAYARTYLEEKLIPNLDQAVEIRGLLDLLETDKEAAFRKYSHALGIGNIRFFLVKGEGVIDAVREDYVSVLGGRVNIATEYIFGNAVRDAPGMISMHEFDNTLYLNEVSGEINRIIRDEVLPPFKARAKEGDSVQFAGAVELNRKYLKLDPVEVVPVTLNVPGP